MDGTPNLILGLLSFAVLRQYELSLHLRELSNINLLESKGRAIVAGRISRKTEGLGAESSGWADGDD